MDLFSGFMASEFNFFGDTNPLGLHVLVRPRFRGSLDAGGPRDYA